MSDLLHQFHEARVLSDLDVAFARRLGRLAEETDPHVLLAAALACRAPTAGHVCVDLPSARATVRARVEDAAAVAALPWPSPDEWVAAVGRSRLVRGGLLGETAPLALEGRAVYLRRFLRYEERLAEALLGRAAAAPADVRVEDVGRCLDEIFGPPTATPSRQRIAVALSLLRRFMVLTGGPGTGKTTILRKVIGALLALVPPGTPAPRVLMLAPTGKAASRLTQAMARPDDEALRMPDRYEALLEPVEFRARTIHGALGVKGNNLATFWRSEDEPLDADFVIVDESSMVHFSLMTQLVEAVGDHARLVLVGDPHQLASVEAGAVLDDVRRAAAAAGGPGARTRDLLSRAGAGPLPDGGVGEWWVHLEKTWRYADDSGIKQVAAAVNQGTAEGAARALEVLNSTAFADVCRLVPTDKGGVPVGTDALLLDGFRPFAEAVRSGEPEAVLDALDRFRVLCGHRRGALSVADFERRVLRLLRDAYPGLFTQDRWFVGRPLLITAGDRGLGLQNGDQGVVLRDPHEPADRLAYFRRPDGQVVGFAPSRLPEHATFFATTVHKSQGSEFDHVVVALPARPSPICTRELLYTGLTRARKRVTLIASDATFETAVRDSVTRFSGLRDRLRGA